MNESNMLNINFIVLLKLKSIKKLGEICLVLSPSLNCLLIYAVQVTLSSYNLVEISLMENSPHDYEIVGSLTIYTFTTCFMNCENL